MPSVLCLYLVNIYFTFSILYMLYILLMARQGPSSRLGRGRPRKQGLPLGAHALPTTSTRPTSTIPTTASTFTPWSSSTYPRVCYDTQPWVCGVRTAALIPSLAFSTSTPTPTFRRWGLHITYTWFHTFPYPKPV